MKLTKFDGKWNGDCLYTKSENRRILEEFSESDMTLAEVEKFDHKNAYVCAGSLNSSAKTYCMYNIRAISRGGRVFLIKTQ